MMLHVKFRLFLLMFCLGAAMLPAGEALSFLSNPLTAGRASLTENGYLVPQAVGTANFSPELRFPIQLIYRSASEQGGMFGYGWSSPQLESSAVPERDGVLWTTPWGEKIKFFAKTGSDKDTLELYKEEMKGTDYFAPYADWTADTSARKEQAAASGNWTFSGKRGYDGWRFVYRDARLVSIQAPSGRSLAFAYSNGQLTGIEQDGLALVKIGYDGKQAVSILLNGVERKLTYKTGKVAFLPKTPVGGVTTADCPRLESFRQGELNPVQFSYDGNGYLTEIRQGDFTDKLTVQTETPAERKTNLLSSDKKNKISHTGQVAGRLLSDSFYTYAYDGGKPGNVMLTDKLKRTAKYDYAAETGIFKIEEFSGKRYTIYYFMRYDVAYLGKVRQIVDDRDRVVVSYRYDKLTGKVTRIRDLAGNDTLFAYGQNGELDTVSRRGADSDATEPVLAIRYDQQKNPAAVSRLDAAGKPVQTTHYRYDSASQPVRIDNGQNAITVHYSHSGYPLTVTDAFGLSRRTEYDKFNRPTATIDVSGVKTEYAYDASGLIVKLERKDGKEVLNSLAIAYDGNGKPAGYTDQSGRVKKFERDAFGRVVKEFFPDETSVEYRYNPVGQLAKVLDQNRHEIEFDWSRFGLDAKTTAAGQLTDYVYDKYGMLAKINSKLDGKTDRSIRYEYDNLDRLAKVTYANDEVETYAYDSWGKLTEVTRGDKKASFRYDYFDRMIEKRDGDAVTTYAYNPWSQRTARVTKNGPLTLEEKRTYDKFGRLVEIASDGKSVKYSYNNKNQLAMQMVDNMPVEFSYTKYGQLENKTLGGKLKPVSSLTYVYAKDGQIAGRIVDGKHQMYGYDKKGQLLSVADLQGKVAESYTYDPAGNILSKTVDGKTTTFTYDKANQLKTSTTDGVTTDYAYDAAGRLVKEGDKTYTYGWLDKILSVQEKGVQTASFDYHMDGQIASATQNGKTENFLWDGLALIHRGETGYINEPYVTGGNPLLSSKGEVMFNDLLGSTLGVSSETGFNPIKMTAFGETNDKEAFFTGKPAIGELGYVFLFRNYRAEQGKWQSSDPLGYPDGWNNLAYVNNGVTECIDWLGGVLLGPTYSEVVNWTPPTSIWWDPISWAVSGLSSLSFQLKSQATGNDGNPGDTPVISGFNTQLLGKTSGGADFSVWDLGYRFVYSARISSTTVVTDKVTENADGSKTATYAVQVDIVADIDMTDAIIVKKYTVPLRSFLVTFYHTIAE